MTCTVCGISICLKLFFSGKDFRCVKKSGHCFDPSYLTAGPALVFRGRTEAPGGCEEKSLGGSLRLLLSSPWPALPTVAHSCPRPGTQWETETDLVRFPWQLQASEGQLSELQPTRQLVKGVDLSVDQQGRTTRDQRQQPRQEEPQEPDT